VIGYGSLISTLSKNKTAPNTGPNLPVKVKGYSRGFNCKGSPVGLSTTFLGVESSPTDFLNGVAFKLEDYESLKEFDRRERYYCRQQVDNKDVTFLTDHKVSESAQFWIYTVKKEFLEWPSRKYPIVQTYVDVFLTGCIEMEETYKISFKDECMNTTKGWEYPYVNDRIIPRRPFVYQKNAYAIDELIEKFLPNHFNKINDELHNKSSGSCVMFNVIFGGIFALIVLFFNNC